MPKPRLDGLHRADVQLWAGKITAPRCCFTCIHYYANSGYCELHEGDVPEAYREQGCGEWLENKSSEPAQKKLSEAFDYDDDIPF